MQYFFLFPCFFCANTIVIKISFSGSIPEEEEAVTVYIKKQTKHPHHVKGINNISKNNSHRLDLYHLDKTTSIFENGIFCLDFVDPGIYDRLVYIAVRIVFLFVFQKAEAEIP